MAKLGEGLQFSYEPIWPQAPTDLKFHYYEDQEDGSKLLKIHEEKFKLISSLEELREYVDLCRDKIIGFDTETTGLTYGKDEIVGFSISLDRWSGIYVPIRHKERIEIRKEVPKLDENGEPVILKSGRPSKKTIVEYIDKDSLANIDPKQALDILYEILLSCKRSLIHNAEFDLNMLKFEGYDVTKLKFFDTLILPYLFDPEATALGGLKALEKRVLGRTVPEFKEVLGTKADTFALVAPKDGYVYACHDKETDVLTEKGWVKWPEYDGKSKLATINLNSGELEYQEPTKIYKYKYTGAMECCKNQSIDYCVTPNHRMIVAKNQKPEDGWVYKEASKLGVEEIILTTPPSFTGVGVSELEITQLEKSCRFTIDYSDFVYCAEVPNHTLITRRNGSTLVSGNCCDTSGVVGIYEEMFPVVKKLLKNHDNPLIIEGKPYDVLSKDNQMVKMFVDYYGHAKNLVNRSKAILYKQQLEKEQRETVRKIYEYFDHGMFNLSTSSKEFKQVMASKDVFTGVKTDKGGESWSKKAAGEMKRNLNKLRECLHNYKKTSYIEGKLDKNEPNAFQLSLLINMFGSKYFKTKSTLNTMTIASKKGEKLDIKEFWVTVKSMYETKAEQLNILSLIHKNNSLNKALNSYVDKLTQVDECIMRYKLKGTKSGRLSSGNGAKGVKRKNKYYIDLNAQNLTKPASAYYKAEKCELNDPEGILGWKFTALDKDYAMQHLEDLYIVEGQDPGITIRGCIIAPKGRYVVSLDYDAEEYKTIAILSQDSKMLDNFYKGIDPHTASAYAIWGEENYDKGKRKKAKIFNFLNNYDGGAYTLAQQLDIPVNDAQEMIDNYNNTFFEMAEWKKGEIVKMYQNDGVVFTVFGRPRQFKGWINVINKNNDTEYNTLVEKSNIEKASFRVKSAIERRVVNHEIQGACGDILRLVLYRLYLKYFKERDPHIDFLSTVHDEINFTIDKEVTLEYVKTLEALMTFDTLDKTLPITTSTDIGYSYGNMFPFVWENDKKENLIPKRVHHA